MWFAFLKNGSQIKKQAKKEVSLLVIKYRYFSFKTLLHDFGISCLGFTQDTKGR